MITIDSLYKEFPDKILFKHISFKLKDNMRVAIVGPNGSGKSTLLKVILNIEKFDSGKVNVGQSISIGYLPQEIVDGTEKSIIEEVLDSFPEISKIEKEIKWKPKFDFNESLKDTVEWYNKKSSWWEPLIDKKSLHPQPWTLKWE